jgi:hypothetical protein
MGESGNLPSPCILRSRPSGKLSPVRNWVGPSIGLANRRNSLKFYSVLTMPIIRYFAFVGGALLALLFVASSYFPGPSAVKIADAAKPVVRVASDWIGPPRVDLDTATQTEIVPAPVAEVLQQEPTSVAEVQPSVPLSTPGASIKIERKKTPVSKRVDRRRMAANPQGFQPFHLTW